MSDLTLEGTIQRSQIGTGTWALIATAGTAYEIYQGAPSEMLKEGQRVKVTGRIRDDVMTLSMIGPVLEVKSFERLSD